MPKTKVQKLKKEGKIQTQEIKSQQYFEAVGRRKTASARVRIFKNGQGKIVINHKDWQTYFPLFEDQQKVLSPLEKLGLTKTFDISVLVKGGGVHSQAEAVRHGIARALLLINPEYRSRLRALGYLTRDPRMRERKKPGLKRARRAPQWQKR